ncbi:acyl-CoA thioesterase [Sphingopyxis sp. 113P3]|uniref:acyl-CoA thioesterase n=1 Tax=Sphingopyxis sp. (strain 113P3) TaxID=292913 RepID=UPI0006BD5408|nr:acyl-CoA thioesterase domain-containing protein [Sphingopyxis sp. 113P3]ALC10480.1 hypothetical protein LH20_00790 [Sphingopyxis sp. 113P3]
MHPQLQSEPLGGDRFESPAGGGDERRTFGGLLIAQTLVAAAATVEGRPCHSLHLLFTGAGDGARPVTLAVERLRDGRAFAARGVRAEQDAKLLASATLSFHDGDEGPRHQPAMGDVSDPETLEDQRETRRRNAEARGRPARRSVAEELVDARPAESLPVQGGQEVRRHLWFRSRKPLGDDPISHQALIAFASDMGLVHLQLLANNAAGGGPLDSASLDHAIWFHRPARADDWLLHVQHAPVAHSGRGLTLGCIYTQGGTLVASVAQEVLIREPRP